MIDQEEEEERKKENISPDLHHNAKNFIGSSKPTRKKTRTKLFQPVDKLNLANMMTNVYNENDESNSEKVVYFIDL